MAYTPFFQGTEAQKVIDSFLGSGVNATTPMSPADMNANNVFRNPYSPEGFYANDTDMYPVDSYKPPVNDSEGVPNCEEGYVYDEVLKSCRFVGFSEPAQEQNRDRGDIQERPYMSIEDMKNASDEDLLDYMTSGFLKNSPLGYLPSKGTEVTMSNMFMPSQFQLLFGNQNEMRKNFIKDELTRRGYFTGNFDKNNKAIFDIGNKNVNTNVGGIESMLPANNMNEPVTDAFGDTYQQNFNDGQGNTGYSFISGTPLPAVSQQTQGGVDYGTGRGGTSSNQITQAQQQAQQQVQQKEKERIDKVVQGMQSGKKTTFGGF